MATRNVLGYKSQIFQYQGKDRVDYVQAWPTTAKGLSDFAEHLRNTHKNVKVEQITSKILSDTSKCGFYPVNLGRYRYALTEGFDDQRYYYMAARSAEKVLVTVDREYRDLDRYYEPLSLLFHEAKMRCAVLRITTFDSARYGKPWGVVGRVSQDRINLEFASPVGRVSHEIRYSDMFGDIVEWGVADVLPNQFGSSVYYDKQGKLVRWDG